MQAVQEEICASVEIAFWDQSYTGKAAANEAREHGVELRVAKQPEAKHGVVLLRCGVVAHRCSWVTRFWRLAPVIMPPQCV